MFIINLSQHVSGIIMPIFRITKCAEREKTNKMQQSDVYYQLVSTCFGHYYAHLQENKV